MANDLLRMGTRVASLASLLAVTLLAAAQAQAACPGLLSRQQVEGNQGALEELAGVLDPVYHLTFWEPGPDASQIDETECDGAGEPTCDSLSQPPGWDEVDETIEHLQQFAGTGGAADEDKGIIDELKDQTNIHLTTTWESWTKLFYDPEPAETEDFYDVFEKLINGGVIEGETVQGLQAWRNELQAIRGALPPCDYEEDEDTGEILGVLNFPCQDPNPPLVDANEDPVTDFATSDGDFDDEFVIVDTGLAKLIQDIESLRQASKDFVDTMTVLSASLLTGECAGLLCGGKNPAGYLWTDSRGVHSVEAEVGPFRVARTKKKKSRKKICIVLVDHSDDGSNAWVKLTRNDPKKDIGFWEWNAHGGATRMCARTAYSVNSLKLAGSDCP